MGCVSCKRPIPSSESIDSPAAGHQQGADPTFDALLWSPQENPRESPVDQRVASWAPGPSERPSEEVSLASVTTPTLWQPQPSSSYNPGFRKKSPALCPSNKFKARLLHRFSDLGAKLIWC